MRKRGACVQVGDPELAWRNANISQDHQARQGCGQHRLIAEADQTQQSFDVVVVGPGYPITRAIGSRTECPLVNDFSHRLPFPAKLPSSVGFAFLIAYAMA